MQLFVCKNCQIEKPSSQFYKHKETRSGFCSVCKECYSLKKKKHYRDNFETIQDYHRQRYINNKELIGNRNKESYQRHIEKRRLHHKEKREEWNKKIHIYYGECCQICGFNEEFYAAYECHHLDPSTKEMEVSKMMSKDWETEVVPELEKCIYICIICHRKMSKGRFDEDIKSGNLLLIPGGKKKKMSLRPKSLSPTCLDTWNLCTLKFWWRYHTKEQDLGDTEAMRFGSAVHAALEDLGKRLMFGEPLSQQLCEEVAQKFIEYAARQRISNPELLKEGQDLVKARLYRHNPNYPVKATELNFYKLQVTTDIGVPLNGIIDLVQEMSPNTALIVDYKTSRKAKTLNEARTDTQLSFYDYVFNKTHPQYQQIWLALDFLRSEAVITERSPDERKAFEQWLNSVWVAMGDLSEKDVTPTINMYCPWCGYKHLCTAYKQVLDSDIKFTPVQSLTSEAEFTEEWKKVKAVEKIAKSRIFELKDWANNRVEMENVFKFEDNDSVISWNQTSRTVYDASRVIPFIPPEDLYRLVTIKNEALENYIGLERPDLRAAIGGAALSTPGNARMTTRKK